MKDGSTLQLSNRKKYLDTVIRQKAISLKSAPKEKLRCSARKGGRSFEYYQVTDSSGRNGIYIPNASHALAKELAQKEYDSSVLAAAMKERELICRLEEQRKNNLSEDLYECNCISRKRLIDPVRLSDDEFVKNWKAGEYQKRGFLEGAPEFYTKKRERVRSKTEVIIANTLHGMKIPYRYEYPLYLDFLSGKFL